MPESTRAKIVGDVQRTAEFRIRGAARGLHGVYDLAGKLNVLNFWVGHRKRTLEGAALPFDDGTGIVLLTGKNLRDPTVSVRKTGHDSYLISRQGAAEARVDDVEAAFLRLKVEEFAAGKLDLGPPQTPRRWAESMRQKLDSARKAFAAAQSAT